MPSIDDCPECNGSRGSQFSYMGQYDGGRGQQPIQRDGPERRCTPVHDRLGKRVDPQEQLEEEANTYVPDEPLAQDPEVQEVHHPFLGIN